ncbi:MAG: medium chain dehydrogenase/reductase family protein [Ignavibacteriaceae bacterium]
MNYKRIIATRRGGPEVLQLIKEELPQPNPKQVRVKIAAAGVSFADVLMREGVYMGMPAFPFTPGYDIIGVIDMVGADVTNIKPGNTVAALTKTGGYAQYILLTEDELVTVPDGIDPAEGVSLILNYITAYQMLFRTANIKEGEKILIHGAAGGVGTALLQLGKLKNLKMYGTASSGKLQLVKELGGIPIDYKKENFENSLAQKHHTGIDVVFESTGELAQRSYKVLNAGGRLILFGISSMLNNGRRSITKVLATYFRFSIFLYNLIPDKKKILLYQITGDKKLHPQWFREDVAALFELLLSKKIKPIISHRLPLSKAAYAHQLLNTSAVSGKIVLMCQE